MLPLVAPPDGDRTGEVVLRKDADFRTRLLRGAVLLEDVELFCGWKAESDPLLLGRRGAVLLLTFITGFIRSRATADCGARRRDRASGGSGRVRGLDSLSFMGGGGLVLGILRKCG